MDTLSTTQEQRLENTIVSAIKDYNSGEAPNDALFKAASANRLAPEFIKRAAQVLNSALQLAHFKKVASDNRKDEFELADYNVVLDRLYPSKEAMSKAASAISFVPSYPVVETVDFNKTAKTNFTLPRFNVPAYQSDINSIQRKIQGQKELLKHSLDNSRMELESAKSELFSSMAKLGSYFRQLNHIGFNELETAIRSNDSSSSTACFMDMLYGHIKGASFNEKRGRALSKHKAYDPDKAPYCFVESALVAGRKIADSNEKIASLTADLTEFETATNKKLRQIAAENGHLKSADEGLNIPDVGSLKNWLITQTKKQMGSKDTNDFSFKLDDAVEKSLPDLLSSEINAEKSQATIELMLHDFMLNDDVISGYDPVDVASAFNEIASLAPRVTQQPLVMRGLLRRHLQQGYLEPMEAGQATGIETDIQKIKTPPPIPTLRPANNATQVDNGKKK